MTAGTLPAPGAQESRASAAAAAAMGEICHGAHKEHLHRSAPAPRRCWPPSSMLARAGHTERGSRVRESSRLGSSKVNTVPCRLFLLQLHKPMTCRSAVPEGPLLAQAVFRICFLVKTEGPRTDREQEVAGGRVINSFAAVRLLLGHDNVRELDGSGCTTWCVYSVSLNCAS